MGAATMTQTERQIPLSRNFKICSVLVFVKLNQYWPQVLGVPISNFYCMQQASKVNQRCAGPLTMEKL